MDAITIMTAHIHVAARTADWRQEEITMTQCTCTQSHSPKVTCAEFRAYQADMARESARLKAAYPDSQPDTAETEARMMIEGRW